MNFISFRIKFVKYIKSVFGIKNMTQLSRKIKNNIDKLFYHRLYTSDDIIEILRQLGVKTGRPLIVHSSMRTFYNYRGTADELIDKLIDFLGPDGTLCMPAYPFDKSNSSKVFDSRVDKSAAGFLSETFRNRPGVKRSINHLHSVCALGKDAELITGEHHFSRICFDMHSPYYIIGQLGGYSINLGMPQWFVGTGEHVCEALLYNQLNYFRDKFTKEITFTCINDEGEEIKQTMLTRSKNPYIRRKSTKLFDKYFDKSKYGRIRLSNLWITFYDMKYLYTRLSELALEGKTIYKYPKFYK